MFENDTPPEPDAGIEPTCEDLQQAAHDHPHLTAREQYLVAKGLFLLRSADPSVGNGPQWAVMEEGPVKWTMITHAPALDTRDWDDVMRGAVALMVVTGLEVHGHVILRRDWPLPPLGNRDVDRLRRG